MIDDNPVLLHDATDENDGYDYHDEKHNYPAHFSPDDDGDCVNTFKLQEKLWDNFSGGGNIIIVLA